MDDIEALCSWLRRAYVTGWLNGKIEGEIFQGGPSLGHVVDVVERVYKEAALLKAQPALDIGLSGGGPGVTHFEG